jgi:guanylate kinase
MEKAIARGEFVEYARVHTNMYGTSLKAVEEVNMIVYY